MIMFNCATLMLITVIRVFIANAKTTQAPNSTWRCLLLKWKELRAGKKQGYKRRMGLTYWPADSCSFPSIQQWKPHTNTLRTSTAGTDWGCSELPGPQRGGRRPCLNCLITTLSLATNPSPWPAGFSVTFCAVSLELSNHSPAVLTVQ